MSARQVHSHSSSARVIIGLSRRSQQSNLRRLLSVHFENPTAFPVRVFRSVLRTSAFTPAKDSVAPPLSALIPTLRRASRLTNLLLPIPAPGVEQKSVAKMDTSVLRAWLGAGGAPVEQKTAEIRSFICEYCPENVAPEWWEFAKQPVAEVIRVWIQAKSELRLHVQNEDKLGMCKKCGCAISLKVFTPIDHILNHTTQEQLEDYPHACWIKQLGRRK